MCEKERQGKMFSASLNFSVSLAWSDKPSEARGITRNAEKQRRHGVNKRRGVALYLPRRSDKARELGE
uniref:Uncharacterized protein n=1 Tax=Pristionchus pacificus TaxID=54126 RepID=A0A2A6C006_PRIPA|eukprot:PDM71470.1 hypothetical protein PRIPAC_37877 [Pristionchus pacificus]